MILFVWVSYLSDHTLCSAGFDAMLQYSRETYIFQDDLLWRIEGEGHYDDGQWTLKVIKYNDILILFTICSLIGSGKSSKLLGRSTLTNRRCVPGAGTWRALGNWKFEIFFRFSILGIRWATPGSRFSQTTKCSWVKEVNIKFFIYAFLLTLKNFRPKSISDFQKQKNSSFLTPIIWTNICVTIWVLKYEMEETKTLDAWIKAHHSSGRG